MKLKSIIACGLLLLGMGAATTSCEDMFEAENNLVTTDLTPNDTLYQMMGIVQRMQKLAERTVLLGEVRADLLDVDNIHSTAYLQGLFENTPEKTKPSTLVTSTSLVSIHSLRRMEFINMRKKFVLQSVSAHGATSNWLRFMVKCHSCSVLF